MRAIPDRAGASGVGAKSMRPGTRVVGHCEVCGNAITVRTRRATYRGRAECACGHRNHVEYRDVRSGDGIEQRHVTVTIRRRFESATHEPDRRLPLRYGICEHCAQAVRLLDAHVIARADSTGSTETFDYYCPACHLHDDMRRGRLIGHDGEHLVDTLRFKVPPGLL